MKAKENSIEEEIKIALDKFLDNKDKDSAILIVEKFILGNYILRGGRTNIVKYSLRYILSDYKRVLKENEKLKNQEATQRKINELLVQRYSNSISVQKVKDKIEEYKNMLKTCNKVKDIDRIKAINERILELQELIKGEK